MTTEYWPWWVGALAMGGLTIAFRIFIGRPLGVSASWANVVNWREQREQIKTSEALRDNADAAKDSILAATLAEFGEVADAGTHNTTNETQLTTGKANRPVPPLAHLFFLLFMFVGSLLVAMMHGGFHLQLELSKLHTLMSGGELWRSWIYLMIGGVMVGFGTQMAGGCSSGHGLSGCSQLAPTSMLATVVFFVSASLMSLFFAAMVHL